LFIGLDTLVDDDGQRILSEGKQKPPPSRKHLHRRFYCNSQLCYDWRNESVTRGVGQTYFEHYGAGCLEIDSQALLLTIIPVVNGRDRNQSFSFFLVLEFPISISLNKM
jgi:hypothetical protein